MSVESLDDVHVEPKAIAALLPQVSWFAGTCHTKRLPFLNSADRVRVAFTKRQFALSPEKSVYHTCRISILAFLFAVAGCRSQTAIRNVADALVAQPDPTVELLESELRWMEDNLYRMDDQLEASLQQLDSAKRNNAALRLELAQRNSSSNSQPALAAPTNKNSLSGRTTSDEKYDEEKPSDDDDPLNLAPPKVELGDSKSTPTAPSDKADDSRIFELPDGQIQVPKRESILKLPQGDPPLIEPAEDPFQDDTASDLTPDHVTRIQLNPRLTGGFNTDRKTGHDGIMVVIEPQNAFAQYAPVPGPVTIELRDPTRTGVDGQIGKWHFSAIEVQPLIKKTLMGQGIHLELPWPAGSPTTERLELSVWYETQQGKKLTARQPVLIKPTTAALVNQADAAEQTGWYSGRAPSTASRWKPTR